MQESKANYPVKNIQEAKRMLFDLADLDQTVNPEGTVVSVGDIPHLGVEGISAICRSDLGWEVMPVADFTGRTGIWFHNEQQMIVHLEDGVITVMAATNDDGWQRDLEDIRTIYSLTGEADA